MATNTKLILNEFLMQFPDDDNGQLLAEIAAAGVDLSKMHQVDFFILFAMATPNAIGKIPATIAEE